MPNTEYLIFTDRELQEFVLQGKKDAIVSFTTAWSSESQFIDKHNVRLSPRFPEVYFIKVNAETDPVIFNTYNLSRIPSTLFIKNGRVVHYISGCPPFDRYQTQIKENLELPDKNGNNLNGLSPRLSA